MHDVVSGAFRGTIAAILSLDWMLLVAGSGYGFILRMDASYCLVHLFAA